MDAGRAGIQSVFRRTRDRRAKLSSNEVGSDSNAGSLRINVHAAGDNYIYLNNPRVAGYNYTHIMLCSAG